MKTVLIMRHAKSSWDNPKLTDPERPLHKRGRKDAPKMGALLRKKALIPQLVISSSALRARQTAELAMEKMDYVGEAQFLDLLYMAEADAYLEKLRSLPDGVERVLVIGHNPGLESLMQILSGKIEALPTASIANISLPIDHWGELNGETRGELIKLWRPKELD
ncbi:MAG TPA: histidine phosphatase family protein [Anaerolineaceae bacterium]|nr:histidine phosphatase family protein [Anaerolineaceae bacterium]